MPWVTINMMSGQSDEEKRKLHSAVAASIYQTLNISPEWVKVQIIEMKDVDHSIGGVTIDQLS